MTELDGKVGTLFLVGTPIGNLEDITLRALRVLREVSVIAAEDTRQTRKLLNHFEIQTPLLSYHEHNERSRAQALVERLQAGEDIAVVTDAGMPGVSDPGGIITELAMEAGVPVVVVPGPTAVVTALVASGLPARRWAFEGFLPRNRRERQQALGWLRGEERTVVFFEAPHRLLATLADLAELHPHRELVVCRELTKRFEEVRRGRPGELLVHFQAHPPKGELTLVLAPDASTGEPLAGSGAGKSEEAKGPLPTDDHGLATAVAELETAGAGRREAIRAVARQTGLSQREVYQAILRARGQR